MAAPSYHSARSVGACIEWYGGGLVVLGQLNFIQSSICISKSASVAVSSFAGVDASAAKINFNKTAQRSRSWRALNHTTLSL